MYNEPESNTHCDICRTFMADYRNRFAGFLNKYQQRLRHRKKLSEDPGVVARRQLCQAAAQELVSLPEPSAIVPGTDPEPSAIIPGADAAIIPAAEANGDVEVSRGIKRMLDDHPGVYTTLGDCYFRCNICNVNVLARKGKKQRLEHHIATDLHQKKLNTGLIPKQTFNGFFNMLF